MGSLSGMFGRPVELENRTETGVDGLLKCGALESFPASAEGVKVPLIRIPFPWAMRYGISSDYSQIEGPGSYLDESLDALRRLRVRREPPLGCQVRSFHLKAEA